MNLKHVVMSVAVLLAAFSACAETWHIKTADNNGNLTTPSHWTNSAGTVASAFNSGDTYVAAENKMIRTPSDSLVFAGGELDLGNGSRYGQMNIYSASLTFNLLKLNHGTIAQQGSSGSSTVLNGAVELIGADNVMRWLYDRQTVTFSARLSGDSSATLSTDVRYASEAGKLYRNENIVLAGDCSGFNGTIRIKPERAVGNVVIGESEYFVKLALAADGLELPGKIVVSERCAIEVTGASAKVGSLTLSSGSIIAVPAADAGVLDVTGSLSFTAPQRLRIAHAPVDGQAHTLDILAAPADVALNPADFALEGAPEYVQFATLGVRTEGGRQILTVSYEPIVTLTVSDGASLARASADDTASIA